jgi:hypothetical protein
MSFQSDLLGGLHDLSHLISALPFILVAILLSASFNAAFAQPTIPVFSRIGSQPVLISSADWEGDWIFAVSVIYDEGTFKAWYTAGSVLTSEGILVAKIGYATSSDGIIWTKHAGNPVLTPTPGSFDSVSVSWASVVKVGGKYYMYYRGYNGGENHIGLATSTDGIAWSKHSGNPIELSSQATNPSVIFRDSQWKMWFAILDPASVPQTSRISYATSSDGVTWSMAANPVGLQAPARLPSLGTPSVLFAGGLNNMWFRACAQDYSVCQIYYATSPDGKTWTRYDENPISGETRTVSCPSVITVGATSYLWYYVSAPGATGIYLATTATPIPEFGAYWAVLLLGVLLAGVSLSIRSLKPLKEWA